MTIPAGVDSGMNLRLGGQGEAGPAGPSTYDDPAHEDFAELNPAAEAAAKQGAPTRWAARLGVAPS